MPLRKQERSAKVVSGRSTPTFRLTKRRSGELQVLLHKTDNSILIRTILMPTASIPTATKGTRPTDLVHMERRTGHQPLCPTALDRLRQLRDRLLIILRMLQTLVRKHMLRHMDLQVDPLMLSRKRISLQQLKPVTNLSLLVRRPTNHLINNPVHNLQPRSRMGSNSHSSLSSRHPMVVVLRMALVSHRPHNRTTVNNRSSSRVLSGTRILLKRLWPITVNTFTSSAQMLSRTLQDNCSGRLSIGTSIEAKTMVLSPMTRKR